ncbi:MAG: hypothetical protein ABJO67_04175 [Pseudoruegeria sp.]
MPNSSPDQQSDRNVFALPNPKRSVLRMILRLSILILIVYLVHQAVDWTMVQSKALDASGRSMVSVGLILSLLLIYAVLIATPFVPGIEIGLSLLLLRGADVVLAVYCATVLGLFLAFMLGRLLSVDVLIRFFSDLRLRKICIFLHEFKDLSPREIIEKLEKSLQSKVGTVFLKSRYLALALAINLPGNAMMGGGGGLCLLAGISRLFSWRWTALTLCLAVAPIPLLVWLYGAEGLV